MDIQFKNDNRIFNCRVVGICIKDNKILLSNSESEDYWTFLGGKPIETGIDFEVDRLLSVMENFFETEGCQWHEYIFFYLLKDTNDLLKVSEEEHIVLDHQETLYKWIGIDDFMKMDIRPYCAKEIIKYLPKQIIHIVNNEI